MMSNKKIPVGISNRHVHLTKEHLHILFGDGYELKVWKDLSQPGQYAAEEKVDVIGDKGTLSGVRVLGPVRKETQIEVSITDSFKLGVKVPLRNSGDIANSAGCKIAGPKGEVTIDKGLIVAARHIHMHTNDAAEFGVTDKDIVKVKVEGERGLVFENVLVRVNEQFALEMHVDVDEGNAAGITKDTKVDIIKS